MYISKATIEQTKHRAVNILASFKNIDSVIPDLKLVRKNISAISTPEKYYKMKPKSPVIWNQIVKVNTVLF